MSRQPKLRKKKSGPNTYWFTEAGGKPVVFGNVKDVSHKDARKLFATHMKNLAENEANSKSTELTAGELIDLFLAWVEKNRNAKTYSTRRTYCSRFMSFRVNNKKGKYVRDLPANQIKSADLEEWLEHLAAKGLDAQTRLHAQTSVKHCWNWGTKHPSPTPYLSPTYRPFACVERVRVTPKTLTEADLITDAEVQILFKAAEIDLDTFHKNGPKTPRPPEKNPYQGFADLLRMYYHTGARTAELRDCLVSDALERTGQIILGHNKRTNTQRDPTPRHITLGEEALAILKRMCAGKEPTDYIFTNSDGKPYHRNTVFERFKRIKEVAREQGLGLVRDEVTIYSFRDLWISDALQAGIDIAAVAHMAGTSVAMIQRVYGHFRVASLKEAQDRVSGLRQKRGKKTG